MKIKRVSIIGLGALGVLFGTRMLKKMPREDLSIIADQARTNRYEQEGIYCNGQLCRFSYIAPEASCEPADLLLFCVKFNGLDEAVKASKNHVGDNTIILSLLNGITSEAIIGQTYGMEKLLYCVAQGMDAVKEGNKMIYHNMGQLCIGDLERGAVSEKASSVADFFKQVEIPYTVDTDMPRRLWGKLMLNVGVNQTVAVYESTYGEVQKEGPARETLKSAMREVIALSKPEGVDLTEDDLTYWLGVLGTLSPEGKPSMRQDLEAMRPSEVELFAGTIIALGRKHGIPTPVNQELYDRIRFMESQY